MKPLPNSLREYRTNLGLRQIDVARKLGFTSADRISHWENGVAYPSVENLAKLCLIYNTCFHQLYGKLFENLDSIKGEPTKGFENLV